MKPNQASAGQQIIEITSQLLYETDAEFNNKKITLYDSLQNNLGIDSLGRAELFQRIEKQFGIQLPDHLLAQAETLEDILQGILHADPSIKAQHPEISRSEIPISQIDPKQAKTLIDVLMLHALGTPDRPHIYLQDEYGQEQIMTYGDLLTYSQCIAYEFLKLGLRPGETIAIMQPTNPGFFYTFFAALLIGCIPVPIYPPFRPNHIEIYARQESKILRSAEVRVLVTFHEAEKLSKLLRAFVPSLKAVLTLNTLLQNKNKAPILTGNENDFALIQYTSGSTSDPKGVLLTHQNLLANIRAYGAAIGIKPTDVTVSWVPLYHDLGLIGMWLGSLYHALPLILLSPLSFLNRPERWLWAIHSHRGTISGGPNFAYDLCVRKIDPDQIKGLDLHSWRLAPNGAEAIQPKTLERFIEKFSPYGFKPETFLPVYGLAESSVCVTTSTPNKKFRIDKIDRLAFEQKNQAIAASSNQYLEFVSCGTPIPGHEIRIVNESNQVLPERYIGKLQFRGPSSMQGYYGNAEATQAIYHNGWWETGDIAYLAEGELFVTGRKKDLIIKAGRNLYPTEIENLTAQVEGIRPGCVAAFGVTDTERGTEKLIVAAETREKNKDVRKHLIASINTKISKTLDVTPDQIILVPPQSIPKTSSGKLQRSACKLAYMQGRLIKKKTPFWLQISRLSLRVSQAEVLGMFKKIGKMLYTGYLTALFFITSSPFWLISWISTRRAFSKMIKGWAKLFVFLSFWPVTVTGTENISKEPYVFISNHASYIDSVLLLAYLPAGIVFAGKAELTHMPFLRTFLRKLGFISVHRADLAKGIEATHHIESVLKQGHSVVIFPEGTFRYAIGLGSFKLGAFKIAAASQTPIAPVVLIGTRYILRAEEHFFSPGRIKLCFLPPVPPPEKSWQAITRLRVQLRKLMSQACGEPLIHGDKI